MGRDRWTSLFVSIVGLVILAGLYSFNKRPHSYEEYLVTNIGALFWLPMVVVLLILRQEPSNFGFAKGDVKRGYRQAALLFMVVLPLLIIAARMEAFQAYYPIQKRAAEDLRYLGYFELTYGMYLFCWEFFFRGFLLFGLVGVLGRWSVLAQAVAFGIMHLDKPGLEAAASFPAGVVLGIVALRSNSFLPCFLVHWASAVAFDVLIILSARGVF